LTRKLITHIVAHANPFAVEGSEDFKTWEEILRNDPDFAVDFSLAAGRNWNGTYPCDNEHRAAYMEEEFDLNERWEEQILSKGSKEEVEANAVGLEADMQSKIELHHLKRKDNA
jgi:hypothetical protein